MKYTIQLKILSSFNETEKNGNESFKIRKCPQYKCFNENVFILCSYIDIFFLSFTKSKAIILSVLFYYLAALDSQQT